MHLDLLEELIAEALYDHFPCSFLVVFLAHGPCTHEQVPGVAISSMTLYISRFILSSFREIINR